MKGKIILGVIIVVLVIGLILLFAGTTIVPTGHVGVVTLYSKVQDEYLTAGFHFIKPFVETVHDIDIRTQNYENTVEGSAKDLQTVNVTISINYNINSESASALYAKVGANYNDTILNPALQSGLKAAMAQYTAEEVITKRNEVADTILTELNSRLGEYFTISAVNIENVAYSDAYNETIETKAVKQQELEIAQAELEIQEIENQKEIAAAEKDAQVMALQNSQVTENVLELKKLEIMEALIEKWNGSLPSTMLGESISTLFGLGE